MSAADSERARALVQRRYGFYRPRILFWSTVGYGTFYFVRKNLPMAMPVMMGQMHFQKTDMGLMLTMHGVLYGVSKFINGMAADRTNARIFMASALLVCAALNLCFGFSSSLLLLGTFWMLNGWFQGMGYPPCARLLTHWFSPRELASKMSIWNISHSLGGAVIVILCAALLKHYDSWRICFFVPAGIALVMGVLLLINLRDTPESLGLPPVERTPMPRIRGGLFCGVIFTVMVFFAAWMEHEHRWSLNFVLMVVAITAAMLGMLLANLRDVPEVEKAAVLEGTDAHPGAPAQSPAPFKSFLYRQVFSNPYIWLVSIANFFVYTIRFAIFDWGPTLLSEYKGMPLAEAASIVAGFEVAGLFGMLITGWLTDRLFGGRAIPLCMISMFLCGVSILLFWKLAGQVMWLNTGLLAAAGFFIYGPQALLAVAVVNLATKKAAATAVGLTSIFGYASTVLSGYGMGWLVQHHGWGPAFACLIGAALIGTALFAAALPAAVHGYEFTQAS